MTKRKLIVADIFGETNALNTLKSDINADMIISPYMDTPNFINEQAAYEHFCHVIGIDGYVTKINDTLEKIDDPLQLIGFSVGASALWHLASKPQANNITMTCFYGSQIRHCPHLTPNCHIDIILPKYEPHFDVTKLGLTLQQSNMVNVFHTNYYHGFMNELSPNFNSNGYVEYIARLNQHIEKTQ